MSSALFSCSKSSGGRRQAFVPSHHVGGRTAARHPLLGFSGAFDAFSPIIVDPVRLMPHPQGSPPSPRVPDQVHLTCSSTVILLVAQCSTLDDGVQC